jgi:hypothetical protein
MANRWTVDHISRAVGWRFRAAVHRAKLATGRAWMPRLAKSVAFMARTGVGTDACLAEGALPLPVHFYSPVPDIADLKARNVWGRRSRMEGVPFAPERQLAFLAAIGARYGRECNWPHRSADPLAFHTDNSGFSYGCATSLHGVLRTYKPKRVIEVGSGNSTRVIAGALRLNAAEGHAAEYMVVDPYPGEDTRRIPEITRFEVERVELVDPALFDALEANDVLFVDSGHTVRIGGDVNFMILDILPRLKPGVVVHFHDIPMPFEYNEVYFTNAAFRMFWTESYLLQAFLSLNDHYETLLAMSWIMTDHKAEFSSAFPLYDPSIHVNSSSSYWIRRTS